MTHIQALTELLRPLGVYDLQEGRVNLAELQAYAVGLDAVLSELEETEREMLLSSAEGIGLASTEELLPYAPVSPTSELRRQALTALLRVDGGGFTLDALNDALSGCGILAQVRETGQPCCVEVYFPDTTGVPEHFEELRAIIEEILPCHLGITYVFQ